MTTLFYPSLDGSVADRAGSFSRSSPDEEVHGAVDDLERPTGIGRRHCAGRRG